MRARTRARTHARKADDVAEERVRSERELRVGAEAGEEVHNVPRPPLEDAHEQRRDREAEVCLPAAPALARDAWPAAAAIGVAARGGGERESGGGVDERRHERGAGEGVEAMGDGRGRRDEQPREGEREPDGAKIDGEQRARLAHRREAFGEHAERALAEEPRDPDSRESGDLDGDGALLSEGEEDGRRVEPNGDDRAVDQQGEDEEHALAAEPDRAVLLRPPRL